MYVQHFRFGARVACVRSDEAEFLRRFTFNFLDCTVGEEAAAQVIDCLKDPNFDHSIAIEVTASSNAVNKAAESIKHADVWLTTTYRH